LALALTKSAVAACPPQKAPEDWRTPKPGGLPIGFGSREASWTVHPPQYCYGGRAVVLYRFFPSSKKYFQNLRRDWAAENALNR
jgi:hypothetical protein